MHDSQQAGHRRWLFAAAAFSAVALVACQDRGQDKGVKAPEPSTTTSTAPAPAPATPMPPAAEVQPSSDPAKVPGKGADVAEKGSATGMIGGESGTVASSGKQGSGTVQGAGTGPAKNSGTQIENKK